MGKDVTSLRTMYDMHSSGVDGLDEREGLEWQVRVL